MNFQIQNNLMKETAYKKKKMVNSKEEGSFAVHFYDSYNNRLKRKVKEEMMAEATEGKKLSFSEAGRLRRKMAPAIQQQVDQILENENHCRHVTWEKDVEVIQEIYSDEEWTLLKDYRWNWERRDLERERMEKKMENKKMVDEILTDIISSIM